MQIEITNIYPPKKPGWSASIKGKDGNYYGVKENIANTLATGQVITADVATKEKDGKTYRDIIKIHDAGPSGNPPASSAPTQSTSHAPRYGNTDESTAERIFVCGFVNAVSPKIYEKMGNVNSEQLTALVQVARVTWAETFGKKG